MVFIGALFVKNAIKCKKNNEKLLKCNKLCAIIILQIKKKEGINTMNKLQLTEAVAAKAEISKKAAAEAVSAVLDAIADALAAGDDIKITGFGSFEVKERAAREGRNPKTGEPVQIPASKYVSFSAGSTLKDKVNG